jgi:hypothetical protein
MEMAESQEQNSLSSAQVERLSLAEQCPVCGGHNQCRVKGFDRFDSTTTTSN